MSRGGRGGGRGRGGGGRGGFGASNLPPMGLSFADIQNMSREATQLYPVSAPTRKVDGLLILMCSLRLLADGSVTCPDIVHGRRKAHMRVAGWVCKAVEAVGVLRY